MRAAREQAGELGQLITDPLDLARYHESAPHRETVRLDLLTEQAVHRLRQRVPHAVIDAELRPCLVHVDPAAVDHAVSNLVDNAVKWSPPDAAVRVVVENGRVSVSDDGPGIARADLPHIFERFYRASDARGMPGAGLGLAIVGSVAQANKGTVACGPGQAGRHSPSCFRPSRTPGRSRPASRNRRVPVTPGRGGRRADVRQIATQRDRLRRLDLGFRSIAGTRSWLSLPGPRPAWRYPMTTAAPSTALVTIRPALASPERDDADAYKVTGTPTLTPGGCLNVTVCVATRSARPGPGTTASQERPPGRAPRPGRP